MREDCTSLVDMVKQLRSLELMPAKIRVGEVEVSFGGVIDTQIDEPEVSQQDEAALREQIENDKIATMYGAGAAGWSPGMEALE